MGDSLSRYSTMPGMSFHSKKPFRSLKHPLTLSLPQECKSSMPSQVHRAFTPPILITVGGHLGAGSLGKAPHGKFFLAVDNLILIWRNHGLGSAGRDHYAVKHTRLMVLLNLIISQPRNANTVCKMSRTLFTARKSSLYSESIRAVIIAI